MITQDRLRELLAYDANTGHFTWRVDRFSVKAGDRAGTFDADGLHRHIQLDGKQYREHHLAWLYVYGTMPAQLDHKNLDDLDNRIANLRECDDAGNQQNRQRPSNNKSGVKGVSRCSQTGKWRAQIQSTENGRWKNRCLGRFDSIEQAASVVRAARERLHGEFANHG